MRHGGGRRADGGAFADLGKPGGGASGRSGHGLCVVCGGFVVGLWGCLWGCLWSGGFSSSRAIGALNFPATEEMGYTDTPELRAVRSSTHATRMQGTIAAQGRGYDLR